VRRFEQTKRLTMKQKRHNIEEIIRLLREADGSDLNQQE
jgi:hypothetical protein